MDQALILEEIERRQYLSNAIDSIIQQSFSLAPKKRLKRGAIQYIILNKLSLGRSSMLCRLINHRMQNAGFMPCVNRGDMYFSNIAFKESL